MARARKRTVPQKPAVPSAKPPKSPTARTKTGGKLKHPNVLFPGRPIGAKSTLDPDLARRLERKTAETDPVVPFDQSPSTSSTTPSPSGFVPPTNPPDALVEQAIQTLARRAVRLAWTGTDPAVEGRRKPSPFQVETAVEVLATFLRQAARTVTAGGNPPRPV